MAHKVPEFDSIDALDIGFRHKEVVVGTLPTLLRAGATPYELRKVIEIFNDSEITIYVGGPTVATSGTDKGRPILPYTSYIVLAREAIDFYGVASSSASTVVIEGA